MKIPVRLRLTLWYTSILAGALLLFSVSVYVLLSRSLIDNLDASLHQRVNQVVPIVDVRRGVVQIPQAGEDLDVPVIPAVVLSVHGLPLDMRVPGSLLPWLRHIPPDLRSDFHALSTGGYRVATAPIIRNDHLVGYLLVWQSLHAIDEDRRTLLLLLISLGPVLLLLTGGGGMLLARRALSPVTTITHTAAAISVSDLHRRVPVGEVHDELSELAATFNAMIERLELAVERQRRFTADASHELRSPLTVILAEASLALEEPNDEATYRAALRAIHEQAAGMKEMITALLTLARTEAVTGNLEVVSLAELVERAVRQSSSIAVDQNIRMITDFSPAEYVQGSPTLLLRAVRNLVDNALRASLPGGSVHLQVRPEGETIVLTVRDEGPGIAQEDQERIFEPFYQVEKARTPDDSHGLGLAICRHIVGAHGGVVTVHSQQGRGATFTISIPAAEEPTIPPTTMEVLDGGR